MGKHRINNIFDQITTDENLMSAYRKARRNKRMSYATLKFTEDLGGNLLKLQAEIRDGSYTPGQFRTFKIYEPKERVIRAPALPGSRGATRSNKRRGLVLDARLLLSFLRLRKG